MGDPVTSRAWLLRIELSCPYFSAGAATNAAGSTGLWPIVGHGCYGNPLLPRHEKRLLPVHLGLAPSTLDKPGRHLDAAATATRDRRPVSDGRRPVRSRKTEKPA
jgi:hypothetical protein